MSIFNRKSSSDRTCSINIRSRANYLTRFYGPQINFKGTILSEKIRLEKFGPLWTTLDEFGPIFDHFGPIWTNLGPKSSQVWLGLNSVKIEFLEIRPKAIKIVWKSHQMQPRWIIRMTHVYDSPWDCFQHQSEVEMTPPFEQNC